MNTKKKKKKRRKIFHSRLFTHAWTRDEEEEDELAVISHEIENLIKEHSLEMTWGATERLSKASEKQ